MLMSSVYPLSVRAPTLPVGLTLSLHDPLLVAFQACFVFCRITVPQIAGVQRVFASWREKSPDRNSSSGAAMVDQHSELVVTGKALLSYCQGSCDISKEAVSYQICKCRGPNEGQGGAAGKRFDVEIDLGRIRFSKLVQARRWFVQPRGSCKSRGTYHHRTKDTNN
jgi:hypothetical protein